MAWDEQAAFGDYRDRSEGPGSFGAVMIVLILGLGGLAFGLTRSGLMDAEYTSQEFSDGPLEDVYTALRATRDGGSCAGACGRVVAQLSALDAAHRAQVGACLSEDDSLFIRTRHGNSRDRIELTMRCGDGALWRAELRNDVSEEALLSGDEIPSNWSIESISPKAK